MSEMVWILVSATKSLINPFRSEDGSSEAIRLYIPQGYPPYSCFYNLTVKSEISVGEVLSSVRTHMGLSAARDYVLAVQCTPQSSQETLAPSGSLIGTVGKKREAAYPRLFLRLAES